MMSFRVLLREGQDVVTVCLKTLWPGLPLSFEPRLGQFPTSKVMVAEVKFSHDLYLKCTRKFLSGVTKCFILHKEHLMDLVYVDVFPSPCTVSVVVLLVNGVKPQNHTFNVCVCVCVPSHVRISRGSFVIDNNKDNQ